MSRWQYVEISHEEAMNTPSEDVYEDDNFYVTKSIIPYTYDKAKVCFFVDYKDGYSYDSYPSLEDAIEAIKKLTREYGEEV